MENSETSVWLDFCLKCAYISEDALSKMTIENEEIGKLLAHMINSPEKYVSKKRLELAD